MVNKDFYNEDFLKSMSNISNKEFKFISFVEIISIFIGFTLFLCLIFYPMGEGKAFWVGISAFLFAGVPVIWSLGEHYELKSKYLDYKIKNKLLD